MAVTRSVGGIALAVGSAAAPITDCEPRIGKAGSGTRAAGTGAVTGSSGSPAVIQYAWPMSAAGDHRADR